MRVVVLKCLTNRRGRRERDGERETDRLRERDREIKVQSVEEKERETERASPLFSQFASSRPVFLFCLRMGDLGANVDEVFSLLRRGSMTSKLAANLCCYRLQLLRARCHLGSRTKQCLSSVSREKQKTLKVAARNWKTKIIETTMMMMIMTANMEKKWNKNDNFVVPAKTRHRGDRSFDPLFFFASNKYDEQKS